MHPCMVCTVAGGQETGGHDVPLQHSVQRTRGAALRRLKNMSTIGLQ